MLLVSIREDFTGATGFSDSDEIREPLGEPLEPFARLTEAQFAERIAGRRRLVLVHGYRNAAESAYAAYAQVARMLQRTARGEARAGYEQIVGFLWPGGWSRIGYVSAVLRANKAGKRFAAHLARMGRAAAVDVQTHSLGARVALEALQQGRTSIRFLHLTAPAVDDEAIERGDAYERACGACQSVYVFHSRNDGVLEKAYRIGDWFDFDKALGYHGPQHPDRILPNTKIVDCQDVVEDHGGYRDAPEYFDYWREELAGPGSPPFVRLARNR